MKSILEPERHYRVLHHKLKGVFAPTYLTILSIIQAVALADLAGIVAAAHQQFTVVNWLLVLLTFWVLIIIWNVYTIQAAIWEWIPDVRDAAMPFVVGALELFLNHTITLSMSSWLLGLAGIATIGALGTWYMHWRAKAESENAQLLSLVRSHHLLFALYYTAGAVLVLLLAWVILFQEWDGMLELTASTHQG